MHVLETPASRDLPDVKLIDKKFCIFILSCDTWQIYLWSMIGKLEKKNNAKRFRKQYISPVGTLLQQILTLCNVSCKYTRISCLVLYKLQEIVSRWDRKVLHGSGFRNLSEFLKEERR
jgi:hypothetical protein